MADDLGRAIRSLLRPRAGGALGPAGVREPIGPTVGVGHWGWELAAPEPQPETASLLLEHGLLTLDVAALLAAPDSTNAVVYLSGSLAAYYATGTLIPESDPVRVQPLVGRYAPNPTLTPPSDWPDGAPLLSGATHPSLHGPGAARLAHLVEPREGGGYAQTPNPNAWTGLARARRQAMVGAGLAADARNPIGFDGRPGHEGLVQDPATGTYWAVEIGAGGLRVNAMAPATTAPLAAWLHAGALTGTGAASARAYVLADLRPSGGPIQLLDAADMAVVYAGSGTSTAPITTVYTGRSGWMWGWHIVSPGSQSWVTSNPAPRGGASRSWAVADAGEWAAGDLGSWYWKNAPTPAGTQIVYIWVWLDPTNPPAEIMLEIVQLTTYGDPEHRAYWGADLIARGTAGTASRRHAGPLPPAGQWVRLEAQVSALGSGGSQWSGMVLRGYGGRVAMYEWGIQSLGESWGDGAAEPIQAGWAFSPDAPEAGIVTHVVVNQGQANQACEAAEATVQITWAGGNPSATVICSARTRWRTRWAWDKLWVGTPEALSLERHGQILVSDADCQASPIITWYQPDGTRRTLRYWPSTPSVGGTSIEGDGSSGCGGGGVSYEYSSTIITTHGGYGFSQPEARQFGTGFATRKEWQVSGASGPAYVMSSGYLPNVSAQWRRYAYCGEWSDINYALACDGVQHHGIWTMTGAGSATAYDGMSFTGGGVQILVFFPECPDVLYVAQGPAGEFVGGTGREWSGVSIVTEVIHGCTESGGVMACALESRPVPSGWSGCASGTPTTIPVPNSGVGSPGSLRVYVGDTVASPSLEWSAWTPLTGNGLDDSPSAQGLWALVSAQGSALYVPSPGAPLATVQWDGILPSPVSVACWSGGA